MDARFMQMHNLVLTREVIINAMFPVDRMRELNVIDPLHRVPTSCILHHAPPLRYSSIAPSPVDMQCLQWDLVQQG